MHLHRNLASGLRKVSWGWIKANVHSSLLFTLAILVMAILALSSLQPGLAELRTLALTLPTVWVVSLAVRIAAQHLSIGEDSLELQTKLGPTGNLSTDYEYLRPIQILKYSVAGHAATIFLVVLGMVITAASLPADTTRTSSMGGGSPQLATLWDVHGGWGSLAWASQIMWVNLLVGILNLLPTVPFDNRALLYGLFLLRRKKSETSVHSNLAVFNSHLSAFMLGTSCAAVALSIFHDIESIGWYALAAAGVYLFVAGRWEMARVQQLEEQNVQLTGPIRDKHHRHHSSRSHRSGANVGEISHSSSGDLGDSAIQNFVPSEASANGSPVACQERRLHVSEAYLDEILRKLHREGAGALSVREQEALLTASQKLKEKHRSKQ